MKKNLSRIFIILLFLVGLSLILYPTISDIYNQYHQSKVISNYISSVEDLNNEEYSKILKEAQEYNYNLANDLPVGDYNNILNLDGTGVMGYIEIPKINVKLPIYHGTSDSVLQVSVGHVEGSSLPIGGENTNSVIIGHRGLPSAKLFTSLDKMAKGDVFYIYFLNQRITYKVDKVEVVLPEETEEIGIEMGKQYVTLITCTPYGVNTHRLVVRGYQLDEEEQNNIGEIEDTVESFPNFFIIFIICLIILLLIILICFYVLKRKLKRKE